ncbi:MAG: DNA/RNA non-specific endonuclease [Porphyromonas sp.]|nr:DNA/RNA non-specific endonuclease [Porphyromonas sp.]
MTKLLFRKSILAVGASLLLLGLPSCGDSQGLVDSSEVLSTSTDIRISGVADGKIRTTGTAAESFFVKVNSAQSWTLSLQPSSASEWLKLGASSGSVALDEGVSVSLTQNTGEQREAKIILTSADNTTSELLIVQQGVATMTTPTPTPPEGSSVVLPTGEHILGDAFLPEVPRLMGGNNMYFVTYKTSDGKPNFSLEYDVNRRHARWVAFSWDKESSKDVTGRNDSFRWDNIIPSQYSTDNWFSRSGFSRGHLVASNDRQHSKEANMQTFYYANMSPQRQPHNEGVWLQLETLLQGWARNGLTYDALYVTKGGTIDDAQIEATKVRNLIVVPKYYWMAVVLKQGTEYHGIAFWTEHNKPSRVSSVSTLAITIDELEKRTGIDLYPNLGKEIEAKVEADTYTVFRWPGI